MEPVDYYDQLRNHLIDHGQKTSQGYMITSEVRHTKRVSADILVIYSRATLLFSPGYFNVSAMNGEINFTGGTLETLINVYNRVFKVIPGCTPPHLQ
mgnify:CR=1 FL=1